MVDVSEKAVTLRTAIAQAEIHLLPDTIELIRAGLVKKGDVLTVSKIAGMMAAKQTSSLIPLCHPIKLEKINVDIQIEDARNCLVIRSAVAAQDKTGVEMEALTAASIAALTVYDMVKAVDRSASIQNVYLLEKKGGKSGEFIHV